MSYYDWQHLVKPFTITPVTEDTVENIKPLSLTPVNAVTTKRVKLLLPAKEYTDLDTIAVPLIIYQYNFSLQSSITIVNYQAFLVSSPFNTFKITLCVRWRVGTIVYRYQLTKLDISAPGSGFLSTLYVQQYTGQSIPKNFVIEVWQTRITSVPAINQDIYLDTGVIIVPADSSQGDTIITANQEVSITTLSTALPETLPTVQDPSGPWLDNP